MGTTNVVPIFLLYTIVVSRLEKHRFLSIIFLSIVSVFIWLPFNGYTQTSDCNCLKVSFLDVGQGDAILIQTPDGHDMLIDGGRDSSVLRELAPGMSFFDKELDIVLATHPDLDHISGLVDVFQRYKVHTFIETTNINETAAVTALAVAAQSEGAAHLYADAGQHIQLGASTSILILSPTGDETNLETNTASIVLQITYGDTSFMLTGDAPQEIENYLVKTYGTLLRSDVLKLGHHGSKTSTSEAWLDLSLIHI